MDLPSIIGHRGAKAYAPENTLAGFSKAAELGATWVEFDVQLSRDGVPVIFHDSNLGRVTTSQEVVAEQTWANLKAIDCGSHFSAEFSQEKIPSLEQGLALCCRLGLGVNIELKTNTQPTDALVDAALSVVQRSAFVQEQVIFSCFDWSILELVRRRSATAQLALLMDQWQPQWQIKAQELEVLGVHLEAKLAIPEHIEAIKSAGYYVAVYTVNSPKKAHKLLNINVDSLFTDYPDLLQS